MEIKLRNRSKAMLLLSLLAFAGMVYAYAQIDMGLPEPKEVVSSVTRGRILTENGLVLAQTVNKRREYPQKTLAGPLVGFMGKEKGMAGLELSFESRLAAGKDVTVTLDPTFQAVAESTLAQYTEEHGGQSGSLVALEVGTGRVLAVANYPAFDPNPDYWQVVTHQVGTRKLVSVVRDTPAGLQVQPNPNPAKGSVDESQTWTEERPVRENLDPIASINHAFIDSYEPGSVAKALSVAALLNDGAVDLEQWFSTPMTRQVGRYTIHDVVSRPTGMNSLNVQGILRYSSNVGMSHLVQNYPPERLHAYFAAYGLGQTLELGGVHAENGILNDWQRWGDIGRVNNSFGQGFSTTTLQMAAAYNVLAEDGLYLRPQLVLEGKVLKPHITHQVLKPETARTVRQLLQYIVEEGIPGQAGVPGYEVGGKTGTAQIVVGSRYSSTLFNSVFSGIFPLSSPRVSMVVMVHGAKKQYHGSQLAAPIFRDVAAEMVSQWGLAPETMAKE